MANSTKLSFSPTITDRFDGPPSSTPAQKSSRKMRWVESVRLGLTVLTLLLGLVIIGTTGDPLRVYNRTSVSPDFILPLWPTHFNVAPTVAILAGGCVVVFVNAVSMVGSKVAAVRNAPMPHTAVSLLAPTTSLIASIIAVAFYYSINTSSTDDSMLSWSCRWKAISMASEPHFKSICRESETGLYVSILLIPVQVVVVALAASTVATEKKARAQVVEAGREKGASPALS